MNASYRCPACLAPADRVGDDDLRDLANDLRASASDPSVSKVELAVHARWAADEIDSLRRRIRMVADAPYCAGCGKLNSLAPREVTDPLRELDIPGCVPSQCPHWTVTAVYDHAAREWVPVTKEGTDG